MLLRRPCWKTVAKAIVQFFVGMCTLRCSGRIGRRPYFRSCSPKSFVACYCEKSRFHIQNEMNSGARRSYSSLEYMTPSQSCSHDRKQILRKERLVAFAWDGREFLSYSSASSPTMWCLFWAAQVQEHGSWKNCQSLYHDENHKQVRTDRWPHLSRDFCALRFQTFHNKCMHSKRIRFEPHTTKKFWLHILRVLTANRFFLVLDLDIQRVARRLSKCFRGCKNEKDLTEK